MVGNIKNVAESTESAIKDILKHEDFRPILSSAGLSLKTAKRSSNGSSAPIIRATKDGQFHKEIQRVLKDEKEPRPTAWFTGKLKDEGGKKYADTTVSAQLGDLAKQNLLLVTKDGRKNLYKLP